MCAGSILGIASDSYVGYLCGMLCECVNVCVTVWYTLSITFICLRDRLPKSMCLGITLTFVRLGRWKHVGKDWFKFCLFFWLFHIICVCVCHVLFFFVCVFGGEMCTKIKCWCFNFVWSVVFPCKIVFLRKEYVYCMVRMYIWYVCLQTNLWVGKPVSHVEIGQKLRRNGMGFESHGVLWFWSMAICTLW